MTQHRLHFECSQEDAVAISSQLDDLLEEDGVPVAAFEADEDSGIWAVSVYAAESETARILSMMREAMTNRGLETEIGDEALGAVDWVSQTLQGLAPVRAGRFVVHGSHDRGCARQNEFAILIDAAMAFGTGHHGTTAGCLEMIDRMLKKRTYANALDLGSGTGVLAIAIAMAAHIPVLATDIDPVAARIAGENARTNGVSERVHSIAADGFHHTAFRLNGPFDLVVANILAGPLQALASNLARHTAPGGTVILSGLLPHQRARILASYRLQGLVHRHTHYRNGWMTLVLQRMKKGR